MKEDRGQHSAMDVCLCLGADYWRCNNLSIFKIL